MILAKKNTNFFLIGNGSLLLHVCDILKKIRNHFTLFYQSVTQKKNIKTTIFKTTKDKKYKTMYPKI